MINKLVDGDDVVVIGRESNGKFGFFSHETNGVAFIRMEEEKETRPFLMRNIKKSDRQLEIDRNEKELYLIYLLDYVFGI